MKFSHRRQFLHLAAGAVALPALPHIAQAQAYPTRPVRILVGFAAGSTSDIAARLIAHSLSERLSQPYIVENRPGAGSNIAAEAVVAAPPDGYTLLLVATSNATNATFYNNLRVNFLRDIAPVSGILTAPYVMVVNPSMPTKTVSDFIAYAKANPGKINMASGGVGSGIHLAGELFNMLAGTKIAHVPYRAAALAVTDLLSGQVQVIFDNLPSSVEYVRTGKLRALAVTTVARSQALPDIPPMADFVPGYEASVVIGIGAPKNTPGNVIERLNKEINAVLAEPKMKSQIGDMGGTMLARSPADFGKLMAEETEKWAKIIKFAGVKAE